MAVKTKQDLLNYINTYIKQNSTGAITGGIMNISLVDIIDSFYSSSAVQKTFIESGVPVNSYGNDNDTYLDTDTIIIYKKEVGVWTSKVDFKVIADLVPTWKSGNGVPISTTDIALSHYIDLDTSDLYQYDGAVWNIIASNKLEDVLSRNNNTNGNDIILTSTGINGDVIKASLGLSALSLWYDGDDNQILLTTNLTDDDEAHLLMTPLLAQLRSNGTYLNMAQTSLSIGLGADISDPMFASFGSRSVIMDNISNLATAEFSNHLHIFTTSVTTGDISSVSAPNGFLNLNSGSIGSETSIKIGNSNSVAMGGIGINVNLPNSAFANQIALQNNGIDFNTVLVPSFAPSADRTIEFPDKSGTVALLSDISGGASNLSSVLSAGNTTDGNHLVVHFTDEIRFWSNDAVIFRDGSDNIAILNDNGPILISSYTQGQLDLGIKMSSNYVKFTDSNSSLQWDSASDVGVFKLEHVNTTATRTQTLQDASGVIALTSDTLKQSSFDIVGNGALQQFVFNHNFANQFVQVQIWKSYGDFLRLDQSSYTVKATNINTITIDLLFIPLLTDDYKVVITSA